MALQLNAREKEYSLAQVQNKKITISQFVYFYSVSSYVLIHSGLYECLSYLLLQSKSSQTLVV